MPRTGSPLFTYLGCYDDGSIRPYADGQQTFPKSLTRAGMSELDCAVAARDGGYAVFAIQDYGKCSLGSLADIARQDAASKRIDDESCARIPCPVDDTQCRLSVNKVFLLEGRPVSATLLK